MNKMKAVVMFFLFAAFVQNIPAQNEYLKSDVLLVKFETRTGENGYYYSVTNLTQDTLKNVSISYKYFDIKTLSLFSAGKPIDYDTGNFITGNKLKYEKIAPFEVNYFFVPAMIKNVKVFFDKKGTTN